MRRNSEYQTESPAIITPRLQLVAWEITRSCNLHCAHCRASAEDSAYADELGLEQCFELIEQIAEVGSPILILTGGEPLARTDIFKIAEHAAAKGLRVVLGTNGTLITGEIAARLKDIPVSRVGVSLDFPAAEQQDAFRGKAGAFDAAIAGIACARRAGLEVQINSTVTSMNLGLLDDLLELALKMGAVAFHPFFLVPTGRGKGLQSVELSPQQYEDALNWVYDRQLQLQGKIFFKPTDAPHYLRIVSQRKREHQDEQPAATASSVRSHPANVITRGCLAGTGFCFISHTGKVQGCGYLDVEAGDVTKDSFSNVWYNSPVFNRLRDLSNIKGKCGICEYKRVCGGCRARAYEKTGDYLEAEPYCVYQPRETRSALKGAGR